MGRRIKIVNREKREDREKRKEEETILLIYEENTSVFLCDIHRQELMTSVICK